MTTILLITKALCLCFAAGQNLATVNDDPGQWERSRVRGGTDPSRSRSRHRQPHQRGTLHERIHPTCHLPSQPSRARAVTTRVARRPSRLPPLPHRPPHLTPLSPVCPLPPLPRRCYGLCCCPPADPRRRAAASRRRSRRRPPIHGRRAAAVAGGGAALGRCGGGAGTGTWRWRADRRARGVAGAQAATHRQDGQDAVRCGPRHWGVAGRLGVRIGW